MPCRLKSRGMGRTVQFPVRPFRRGRTDVLEGTVLGSRRFYDRQAWLLGRFGRSRGGRRLGLAAATAGISRFSKAEKSSGGNVGGRSDGVGRVHVLVVVVVRLVIVIVVVLRCSIRATCELGVAVKAAGSDDGEGGALAGWRSFAGRRGTGGGAPRGCGVTAFSSGTSQPRSRSTTASAQTVRQVRIDVARIEVIVLIQIRILIVSDKAILRRFLATGFVQETALTSERSECGGTGARVRLSVLPKRAFPQNDRQGRVSIVPIGLVGRWWRWWGRRR